MSSYIPTYVPVLRAKQGEFDALDPIRQSQLKDNVTPVIHPFFEIQNIIKKDANLLTEITSTCSKITQLWSGNTAMVDGYYWQPSEAILENGEHFLTYAYNLLYDGGVKVVPVIGYDRWFDQASGLYRQSMGSLICPNAPYFCIRVDGDAFYDLSEPEFFEDQINEIIDSLKLSHSQCSIMIDFGNVSLNRITIEEMLRKAKIAIEILNAYDFKYISISGASYPEGVNYAVLEHDTDGSVLRKEMIAWQSLRETYPDLKLVFGDYGIRLPSVEKVIKNKHINGKIIYTIDLNYFVVRGHPVSRDGGKYTQMPSLASRLVNSVYYEGSSFSWGDQRIADCAQGTDHFIGNSTQWVAIGTSHHIKYVLEEIENFEFATAL